MPDDKVGEGVADERTRGHVVGINVLGTHAKGREEQCRRQAGAILAGRTVENYQSLGFDQRGKSGSPLPEAFTWRGHASVGAAVGLRSGIPIETVKDAV